MSALSKVLTEDIDIATFKVKLGQGVRGLTAEPERHRKRELHVSDFTQSEKQFCYRKLVLRYFKGEDRTRGVSMVQLDGKWREDKWRRIFESAGILKDYQEVLRVGMLVGHPDFLVDYGRGDTILELTGHDSKIDPILRQSRLAVKKRQCLTYLIMRVKMYPGSRRRALVVVENKGNNEFQVYPVDYDEEKATLLMKRVVRVQKLVTAMGKATPERRTEIYRQIPRCGTKNCKVCYA
jgi:hypothetical protein